MNITTPMNWVNSSSGVKKDHTGHKATLKLKGKDNVWLTTLAVTYTNVSTVEPTGKELGFYLVWANPLCSNIVYVDFFLRDVI